MIVSMASTPDLAFFYAWPDEGYCNGIKHFGNSEGSKIFARYITYNYCLRQYSVVTCSRYIARFTTSKLYEASKVHDWRNEPIKVANSELFAV